jgi:hypothetical protein
MRGNGEAENWKRTALAAARPKNRLIANRPVSFPTMRQ